MSRTNSSSVSWSVGPIDDLTSTQCSSIAENVPDAEIGPESFGSIMTTIDVRAIRSSCFIPSEFLVVLSRLRERVHNPPP